VANDADIEDAILELLRARDPGKTICPSEAARQLADDWRPLMDDVRAVGRRLADDEVIDVTQGGEVVDPHTARGPIRYRLKRANQSDSGESGD
jgi:hypothetical protein